jgi:hypothetical protein
MDLFAKPITKEELKFQKWQADESNRLQREQEKFLAERLALKATMTDEEWEEYLQVEAIENAQKRAATTENYEVR